MLSINISSESEYILVTLKGHLDGSQTGPVSQKIGLALIPDDGKEGIKTNLIIDISDLSYISSGGLGILLAFHRKVKEADRRMIICNPSPMVAGLLDTTGMYGVFQVQPSVDSAIRTIRT